MLIIELPESKLDKLADTAQKMHKCSKRIKKCIDEILEAASEEDDDDYGNRDDEEDDDDYGNRDGGSMGQRSGSYGNRRGVKGTGRYSRSRRYR